ncbi:SOS response-associated peptidase family protein [Pseudomonas sp. GX19020]|uniref:SOS response-associated peptidase family protein n=1 Tax=Pseudomonas sp. GX19020 TaxID=2942277 RepID=UPI002018B71D|nr:SOS response-associated peptidase family protein [Pseudomonas sp. GX19020]MCL4065617.1 SOS response-associated peptidase family protein [Pseudomonas sp. GX19020]
MFATPTLHTGGAGLARRTAALCRSSGSQSHRQGKCAGNAWFALKEDRPAFFAGIWVPDRTSIRKLKDGETTDDLFAFLTCDPNAEVAEIHTTAMPVILTEPDDWEEWLVKPWTDAKSLQGPLPAGSLEVIE